jgi:hypothetical protein
MKKLILFTLAVGMIAGCRGPVTEKVKPSKTEAYQRVYDFDFAYVYEFKIDGCEYLSIDPTHDDLQALTHKGNCKNLIHKKDEQR